jgi:hypothetical protein
LVRSAVKGRAAATSAGFGIVDDMKELLRTNDPVHLTWAMARLAQAGIDCVVLDQHTSIVEGSIGAIQRRLVVAERDYRRACGLIMAPGDAAP